MGADGHIGIYDWTKTVKQFPELIANKELYLMVKGNAYVYSNPVGEGEWLVIYWGDNLLGPIFPGYETWWGEKYPEESKTRAKEIVQWMLDNAVIVYDWEVWT